MTSKHTLARAVSQGLRLSKAPDGYKLRTLARLFDHVDDAINERASLQALIELRQNREAPRWW